MRSRRRCHFASDLHERTRCGFDPAGRNRFGQGPAADRGHSAARLAARRHHSRAGGTVRVRPRRAHPSPQRRRPAATATSLREPRARTPAARGDPRPRRVRRPRLQLLLPSHQYRRGPPPCPPPRRCTIASMQGPDQARRTGPSRAPSNGCTAAGIGKDKVVETLAHGWVSPVLTAHPDRSAAQEPARHRTRHRGTARRARCALQRARPGDQYRASADAHHPIVADAAAALPQADGARRDRECPQLLPHDVFTRHSAPLRRISKAHARPARSRSFFRMGNWIGGDRDGNPNVVAETLEVALLSPERDGARLLPRGIADCSAGNCRCRACWSAAARAARRPRTRPRTTTARTATTNPIAERRHPHPLARRRLR